MGDIAHGAVAGADNQSDLREEYAACFDQVGSDALAAAEIMDRVAAQMDEMVVVFRGGISADRINHLRGRAQVVSELAKSLREIDLSNF